MTKFTQKIYQYFFILFMIKEGSQIEKQKNISLQKNKNPDDFIIAQPQLYPNRLICHIKIKIYVKEKHVASIYGSGTLIHQKYLITAAHTFDNSLKQQQKYKQTNEGVQTKMVVKQGLTITEFKVIDWWMSKKFKASGSNKQQPDMSDYYVDDFAMMKLEPISNQATQKQYIPVVALNNDTISKISQITMAGYPLKVNQQKYNRDNDLEKNQRGKSSQFFNYLYGDIGSVHCLNEQASSFITYKIPTGFGISGTGILANLLNRPILFALHKGKKQAQKYQQYNYGISVIRCIEECNAYSMKQDVKEPFVYTENTLYLRDSKQQLNTQATLMLISKGFYNMDLLVLIAFDLTKVKEIYLSKNNIENKGFEFLTRRNFPNLKKLYLTQNKIQNLSAPEQNWNNISELQCFGLNENRLETLPQELLILKKLKTIWLIDNKITTIPSSLCEWSKIQIPNIKKKVYLNKNKIKKSFKQNQLALKILVESNIQLAWDEK